MKKLLSLLILASFLATTTGPAYATSTGTSTGTTTPKVKKTVDLACMQAAVEKRDNAIIAAWDTFHASAKTALETRRNELKAAWGITDAKERSKAIKAAWKKYRDSIRISRRTFRDAKRGAWRQFNTDRRACRGTASSDDLNGQGYDENL